MHHRARRHVAQEHVERLKALLWEFQELNPSRPDTWDKRDLRSNQMKELNSSGMVEMYNHQYLWDSRATPRVYDAFVDIWDREDLWVTIDRANLNTPNRSARPFSGFIHWDSDTSAVPLPVNVQGVIALVDTDPEVGGFQCVPELFRNFSQWIASQPPDRNPFQPDITGFEIEFVPMKAGDLLIFNTLLAHGIRPNTSADRARIAQYISMYPADETNEAVKQLRIRQWREREAPKGIAFPGDQQYVVMSTLHCHLSQAARHAAVQAERVCFFAQAQLAGRRPQHRRSRRHASCAGRLGLQDGTPRAQPDRRRARRGARGDRDLRGWAVHRPGRRGR